MDIYYTGHQERYALEQMGLLFFPNEKLRYVNEPPKDSEHYLYSSLEDNGEVSTLIFQNGQKYFFSLKQEEKESLRDTIKKSCYFCVSKFCNDMPPWGTLTGIRPSKLMSIELKKGKSDEEILSAFQNRYLALPNKAKLAQSCAKVSQPILQSISPKAVGIYIAVPFCPGRCLYCSFVSHNTEKEGKLLERYIPLLLKELSLVRDIVEKEGLLVNCLYIGGGTPTVLSDDDLRSLLETASSYFYKEGVEFTIEGGRPETLTKEKLAIMKEHHVSRLCINPQTMNDKTLLEIGRRHTKKDILEAFERARAIGFHSINSDLIAGLPGENIEDFKATMDSILALSPENVTVHTLSIKRGSNLKDEQRNLEKESKEIKDMVDLSQKMLADFGYHPYYLYRQKNILGNFENVGFSKPGYECIYNIGIMEEAQTILSAGAGGVTKLYRSRDDKIERIFNQKYPLEYIENFHEKILKRKDYISEFFRK